MKLSSIDIELLRNGLSSICDEMFLAISRSQAIHVRRFHYSLSVCGRVRTDAVRAAGHEVLGELCPYCLTWLQRTSRTG